VTVFADWTAPVGAVASAVAAIAALVAIVYAKRAAEAAQQAIDQQRKLRVEDHFREFGRALWTLQEAANVARLSSKEDQTTTNMRHAQTRLTSVLVPRVRIQLPDEAASRLEKALSRYSDAVTVYSAASGVVNDLHEAWDTWRKEAGE